MQKPTWYLQRLKSMDGPEIRWRFQNLIRDQLDLVRIPLGYFPKLSTTPCHTAGTFRPGFSCSPVHAETWGQQNSAFMPEWRDRLITKADAVLDNRLSYLNLNDQFLGDPVNWHRDFSSGIDAPVKLAGITDYRDFRRVGDCKHVWEPNRHHQLVVLARAYRVTRQTQYATKIAELLRSWIEDNPFGYGMNWKSPLEMGVRIINWIWSIDLIKDSDAVDRQLWNNVLQTIYVAMWDIHRKFSRGSSANNHLIGESAGVYIGTCYFPDFPKCRHWRKTCKTILEREIIEQTYADGCTREHAFGYQFFMLQFFALCATTGKAAGDDFSAEYMQRLHKMYQFMGDICADTGLPPNMGDKDNGYVLDLGDLPNNAEELIAVGHVLFDDATLASEAGSETAYWLFGKPALTSASPRTHRSSSSYPESGYYLLRSEQNLQHGNNRMTVFFDCAQLGYGAIAAHGHADCLSFCLNIGALPVFVDSGTYDYFTFPDWRDYFRQTRAHNTAEIDCHSQSELLGPFLWGRRADPSAIKWHDDECVSIVVGEHDGYTHLQDPVIHRRTMTLEKRKQILEIRDFFSASSSHQIALYFHLDSACKVSKSSDRTVLVTVANMRLKLSTKCGSIRIEQARKGSKLGWISKTYHRLEASNCIVVDHNITGDSEFVSTIELHGRQ